METRAEGNFSLQHLLYFNHMLPVQKNYCSAPCGGCEKRVRVKCVCSSGVASQWAWSLVCLGRQSRTPFQDGRSQGVSVHTQLFPSVRAEPDEPLSTTSPSLSGFPVVPSTSSCYHFSSWSLWKQGYSCPGSSFEVDSVHSRWPPKS